MNILEVRELKKYYGEGENQVKALDGVSLSVEKGEFLAVVGTSGSGKSTLLHMMGGLDTPTSGQVVVAGKDISSLSRDELTIFRRRKIGFVFQSYNLLPLMNVYDNIVLPIKLDGIRPDEVYVPCPISFPAGSSNGLLWQERWRQNRLSFLPTSPPGILTVRLVWMCWD